jgi:hypothetical protein
LYSSKLAGPATRTGVEPIRSRPSVVTGMFLGALPALRESGHGPQAELLQEHAARVQHVLRRGGALRHGDEQRLPDRLELGHANANNNNWTYTSGKHLVVYGNKCLDAYGAGTVNGTMAVIWDCNGRANQQWNLVP